MRQLATIQIIKSLSPIPNADSIEKAEVLGWEVVVKKNDFKVGDKVCFCEIDSVLPDLPVFEFLRSKKFRIKTCKLRGCVSQGIVFPLSTIKAVCPTFNINCNIGDDVTDVLKIIKYDPEASLDIAEAQPKNSWILNKISFLKWKLFGIKPVSKGAFPTHLVTKTDEIRVQKMGSELEKREGQLVYVSEKLEGSSATFIYRRSGNWLAKLLGNDYIFQICSRNKIVYNSRSGGETNHYLVQLAEKHNMLEALKKLNRNIAVQGESLGPKIQGNIYKLPEHQFRVFIIYDLDTKKYLPFREAVKLTTELGLQF